MEEGEGGKELSWMWNQNQNLTISPSTMSGAVQLHLFFDSDLGNQGSLGRRSRSGYLSNDTSPGVNCNHSCDGRHRGSSFPGAELVYQ